MGVLSTLLAYGVKAGLLYASQSYLPVAAMVWIGSHVNMTYVFYWGLGVSSLTIGWLFIRARSEEVQARKPRTQPLAEVEIPKFSFNKIKKSSKMQREYGRWLAREGFAVFELDDEFLELVNNYWEDASKFFEKDMEYKRKFAGKPKYEDQIFTGRQENKGYLTLDEKEFLKLARIDPKQEIPEEVNESFQKLITRMENVMKDCYKIAGRTIDERTLEPVHSDDTISTVSKFFDVGSSISMINYHPLQTATQKIGRDEPTEETHFPSSTHKDTGLLTLIMCSDVPALQIEDRVTKEWFMPETVCTPRRHCFVIVGTKFPMMAQNLGEYISATTHRVSLPYNTQRFSLLYFQDVPV